MNENKEMATIPYIVHEARMYRAYKRERLLKTLLLISNTVWLSVLLFVLSR